jgi:riboflavin synthase
MFTGIIEEVGTVGSVFRGRNSAVLSVAAKTVCAGTKKGDSIAVDGVCLTVTSISDTVFTAEVMAETLSRSGLGKLKAGSRVNLERALTLSSRIGGHQVSGHMDGTGTIRAIRREDIARVFTISCESKTLRYIVAKGSVALDGISLTVCAVRSHEFSVSVIPHTIANTTLSEKKEGGSVNIECDITGKYIEKFFGHPPIDERFLNMHGFLEA